MAYRRRAKLELHHMLEKRCDAMLITRHAAPLVGWKPVLSRSPDGPYVNGTIVVSGQSPADSATSRYFPAYVQLSAGRALVGFYIDPVILRNRPW
jgi:hypothetical protein